MVRVCNCVGMSRGGACCMDLGRASISATVGYVDPVGSAPLPPPPPVAVTLEEMRKAVRDELRKAGVI